MDLADNENGQNLSELIFYSRKLTVLHSECNGPSIGIPAAFYG